MDNLEVIEDYFKGSRTEEERKVFENKILGDPSFADDAAFYISTQEALKQELLEEKKQGFREIYARGKVVKMARPARRLWKYIAAASIIIVLLLAAWFFVGTGQSPKQLADNYIKQNFLNVGVTMGTQDSLQKGLTLMNAGNLTEALQIFEILLKNEAANKASLQKYAGIVSLRLGDYDRALEYFSELEKDTTLYSKPGTFFKATTLLSRNKEGDKAQANELLHKVIDNNLEGENEAKEWIKHF